MSAGLIFKWPRCRNIGAYSSDSNFQHSLEHTVVPKIVSSRSKNTADGKIFFILDFNFIFEVVMGRT